MNNSLEGKKSKSASRVSLSGAISDRDGARLLEEVSEIVSSGAKEVVIDLGNLERLDSRGGAWLVRAVRQGAAAGAAVSLAGAKGEVAGFIELIRSSFEEPPAHEPFRRGLFESLGEKGISVWKEFIDVCRLIVDSVYWCFIAPVEGRGIRWKGLLTELYEMGSRAVGIICLLNFLMGLVIAMLSAAQMRLFGVEILVASLVVIGFARELAAVMTGVMVSARTGSAIASELATMTVSEEIDALRGMGINVTRFLIAPKVLSIMIAMPILTMFAFVTGVAGGFALGIFSLGFTFDRWWTQTVQALTLGDLGQGLIKSFFFAMIIVMVGCHNGLRVTGGARGVGLATTRSVVMDIFFIIVADMVFATFFYFFT